MNYLDLDDLAQIGLDAALKLRPGLPPTASALFARGSTELADFPQEAAEEILTEVLLGVQRAIGRATNAGEQTNIESYVRSNLTGLGCAPR